MSRIPTQKLILTSILELSGVAFAFFIAYSLRLMRDWIPLVQLPIPYISYDQFIPFVISGVVIWCIVFIRGGLYSERPHTPIVEEIRRVLTYSFFWFFVYIGFVYLSTGFVFAKEIPRLIILYAYVISTLFSVIIRYSIHTLYSILYTCQILKKETILVISNWANDEAIKQENCYNYTYLDAGDKNSIETTIRHEKLAYIIYMWELSELGNLFQLAKIYGIALLYPQISRYTPLGQARENWIWGIPMIELRPVAITAWWRIAKRIVDIMISSISIVILVPVFGVVALGIWISDPSGPIIYRNRRIGQYGEIFALYKFRYMYWRYCTKEEYGITDDAMAYEETLKKEKNTREWPLYKIKDDPRMMWFGRIIERLSIDELPQLWNVLKWDMSLIGPRPHQPREIDLYDESDKQVLTIKPGITGMAQVYGRDTNTFRAEIALDTYYIEHYSASLDLAILLRTVLVVIQRVWR